MAVAISAASPVPARHSVQANGLPPRLTSRGWNRIHDVEAVLLPYALDYDGYPVDGSSLTWIPVKEIDKSWYLQLAWWARSWGFAIYSYDKMAEAVKWPCSREKARRRVRRLVQMGLIWADHTYDAETGEFKANRYAPLHPMAPWGQALAIRTYGEVVMLTTAYQISDLPAFLKKGERRRPAIGDEPSTAPAQRPVRRAELVLSLPTPYMAIARQERVTDALVLSRVWELHQSSLARAKAKNRPIEKPFAYFRKLLRVEREQMIAMAAQAGSTGQAMPAGWPANTPPPNPEAERLALMEFLISTSTDLLARGADVAALRQELPQHPFLPRYLRTITFRAEDLERALVAAQDRAADLRQRREAPSEVPADWVRWVVGRANVYREKARVPAAWMGEHLMKDDDPLKPAGLRTWTRDQLQALYERLSSS